MKRIRACILACIVPAVLVGTSRFASAQQAAPYTFGDAFSDITPDGKGRGAVADLVRLMEKADVRYLSDPKTEEFFRYFKASLEKFDFMKIWNGPYLQEQGEGHKGVRLQGCSTGDRYTVKLITDPEASCAEPHMGDYQSRYSLKINEQCVVGGRSFVVDVQSVRSWGRFSHRSFLRFAEGLLKVIDPDNLARIEAPESGFHPAVTGDARRVVNLAHMDFPRLSALFNRYAGVRSLLTVKSHNGVRYTHLDFRYGYRSDAIKRDFPVLARSLDATKGLYRIVMTVKNARANPAMRIVFDSRDDALEISLVTRQGKIVPVDEKGSPLPDEAITPSEISGISYFADIFMEHNVHGLVFTTKAVRVDFGFSDTPAEGIWRMKLGDVSPTRISGLYYDIIPPWIIDAFIPRNMEGLISDLGKVMLQAEGGQGSTVVFRWDTRDPENVRQHFRATSEFMDNYFMRYGLRVWTKSTVANKNLTAEIQALTSKVLEALKTDYDIR
jgi:hypothetical protein